MGGKVTVVTVAVAKEVLVIVVDTGGAPVAR